MRLAGIAAAALAIVALTGAAAMAQVSGNPGVPTPQAYGERWVWRHAPSWLCWSAIVVWSFSWADFLP